MNTPEHSAAPDIIPPHPAGLCRWCWLPEHHHRDLPGRIKCLSNQLHTLPKQAPSACKEKLKHKSCRLLKALCNLHSFRCLGWTPWYFLLPSVQNQQTQGSPQLFKQVSLFSFPSCFAVRLIINAIPFDSLGHKSASETPEGLFDYSICRFALVSAVPPTPKAGFLPFSLKDFQQVQHSYHPPLGWQCTASIPWFTKQHWEDQAPKRYQKGEVGKRAA